MIDAAVVGRSIGIAVFVALERWNTLPWPASGEILVHKDPLNVHPPPWTHRCLVGIIAAPARRHDPWMPLNPIDPIAAAATPFYFTFSVGVIATTDGIG